MYIISKAKSLNKYINKINTLKNYANGSFVLAEVENVFNPAPSPINLYTSGLEINYFTSPL